MYVGKTASIGQEKGTMASFILVRVWHLNKKGRQKGVWSRHKTHTQHITSKKNGVWEASTAPQRARLFCMNSEVKSSTEKNSVNITPSIFRSPFAQFAKHRTLSRSDYLVRIDKL